jgi:hypothetical protein
VLDDFGGELFREFPFRREISKRCSRFELGRYDAHGNATVAMARAIVTEESSQDGLWGRYRAPTACQHTIPHYVEMRVAPDMCMGRYIRRELRKPQSAVAKFEMV